MTVVRAWLGNGENDAISADGVPPSLRQTLIHSICLNSTGRVAAAKEVQLRTYLYGFWIDMIFCTFVVLCLIANF